jgi:hypothetical protein
MSEHLLFLQAAGSDFSSAHDLVAAVTEAIRAPDGDDESADAPLGARGSATTDTGLSARRTVMHPERIAERVERAGWTRRESLLIALAVHTTAVSPHDVNVDWIASVAARVGEPDLVLETAGVVFAFNTVNRIADARRVKLEYRFLRELKPIRGWVERRFASLTGLAYDLSYRYRSRQSSNNLRNRLEFVFERLGAPSVPQVFQWLSQSPVVLEGVLEMVEANVTNSGIRFDLMKEAAAIGVASRAKSGSDLSLMVDRWASEGSLPDSKMLRSWASQRGVGSDACVISACRQYSWKVANAAHTISDEQIGQISALGFVDAELMDLTLATAVFSALAIIEPIVAAVAPKSIVERKIPQPTRNREVQVQIA